MHFIDGDARVHSPRPKQYPLHGNLEHRVRFGGGAEAFARQAHKPLWEERTRLIFSLRSPDQHVPVEPRSWC